MLMPPPRCPWAPPGPGRGGRHPVPAVAGEDSPTGAGGRVFGGSAHRCTSLVSAAPQTCLAQQRAAGDPQHLPASLLPSRAQEHSRGPSFQSISASGLNAALAHYRYGWGSGGRWAGGGASDMWHAQTVQTVSYRLTEHTYACFVGLAAVSAVLMDGCILFVCGKGWQQETRH